MLCFPAFDVAAKLLQYSIIYLVYYPEAASLKEKMSSIF